LLVGSIAGAIVSSTAVTVALARMARAEANAMPLVGGAALAALVSILRVCAIVALLAPPVIVHVIGPAIAGGLVLAVVGAVLLLRNGGQDAGDQPARNPFEVGPLLVFAAAFALVSTVSAALSSRFGESGLLITTAVSGAFDVDVAVLSSLRLVEGGTAAALVAQAVLVALAANAMGRLFLALLAGPVRFTLPLAAITACAAAVAIAAFMWLPFA
jgi:uncharacterized membrane protein (DUF4010 family)